jgi:type II secretory ATPase GspE/PulE/Tfp pilus assembly ATPase PilB-like protein
VPISFTSVSGYVAAATKLVNIKDVYDAEELNAIHFELGFNKSFDEQTGFRTRQVLAAPIMFDGALQGVLQLINTNDGMPFTDKALEAIGSIADTLGIAMNNRQQAQARRTPFDGLYTKGLLTEEELEKAREYSREESVDLEEALMGEYKVKKEDLLASYGAFYRREVVVYSEEMPIPVQLVGELNGQVDHLKFGRWCPVSQEEDGRVIIAIDDPRDVVRIDHIRVRYAGKRVDLKVALHDDIVKMINLFFGVEDISDDDEAMQGDINEMLSALDEGDDDMTDEPSEDDNAICRLVNQIIVNAYKRGASDIHIEPYLETDIEVRVRIDGDMIMLMKLPTKLRNAIVSRIKIMSDLDIAERRKPQDGKIKFKRWGPLDIELRVATLPTVGAMEDVVMRILAASKPIPLKGMGMSEHNYDEFTGLLKNPYGIVLCVGPTGSGKTTTLHSALGFINKVETKIWTAEDPVEITQKGLRQCQVNKKAGLDFAVVMKAFLRADPDVIMVGEMRDLETTATGIEASLTGHLVFSTLHTNNAPETVTRLLDMGIDEFSFADALLGVLAQRLGRTLCKDCKEKYTMTDEEWAHLKSEYAGDEMFEELGFATAADANTHRAPKEGCAKCNNSGFRGRCGIHELLSNNMTIKNLIFERAKAEMIREAAIEAGMRTLKQDGISKVLSGLTTLEKVRQVCSA